MGMERIYRLIKLNRMVRSHRVKFAGILFLHLVGARALFLRFDPVIACNLHCQMCYFSDKDFRKKNKGAFDAADIDRLAEMFFPRTLQVVFGCGAEPTLYKDYPDLVRIAKSYDVPNVGMVSNGQRFTDESIRQLIENGLDELMLSVHGVTRDSYETLMTGASYEKFHAVLRSFDRIKAELGVSNPTLRLNYTVNPDNLAELRDFFDVFGGYGIHTLQLRPIMDIGQAAYRNFDLDRYIDDYNEVIDHLNAECRRRDIRFLARKKDPAYRTTEADYGSIALDSVLRFVSPQRVWRTDFDWRNESYDAFCRRIGFTGSLLKAVFSSRKRMIRQNPFKGTLTLSYDVL